MPASSAPQLPDLVMEQEESPWPNLTPGPRTYYYPYTLRGPKFELRIEPPTKIDWMKDHQKLRYQMSMSRRSPVLARRGYYTPMGLFLIDDIIAFISMIINAIIQLITAIIAQIIAFFTNPLSALQKLLETFINNAVKQVFLTLLKKIPVVNWLFTGLDYVTGGFLSNLTDSVGLPSEFPLSEALNREDLLGSLNIADQLTDNLSENGITGLLSDTDLTDSLMDEGQSVLMDQARDALPGPVQMAAGVATGEETPGEALEDAGTLAYDSVEDKAQAAAFALDAFQDPSKITDSLKSPLDSSGNLQLPTLPGVPPLPGVPKLNIPLDQLPSASDLADLAMNMLAPKPAPPPAPAPQKVRKIVYVTLPDGTQVVDQAATDAANAPSTGLGPVGITAVAGGLLALVALKGNNS